MQSNKALAKGADADPKQARQLAGPSRLWDFDSREGSSSQACSRFPASFDVLTLEAGFQPCAPKEVSIRMTLNLK